MKTALLILFAFSLGAYFQNIAWDWDGWGMFIVWTPGIPILAAAVILWRRYRL